MNAVDWAIIIFALLLAPLGYRRGMVVGALTLLGFAAGALVGSRLGPLLLSEGAESPYAPALALLGGVVIGGILSVVLEGAGVALRARLVRGEGLRRADAVGGAMTLAVLALAISWVLGAVALNAPALREYRQDVQRSAILGALNETLPPSGPILNVLNRIDPTPALRGPSADVAAPNEGILGKPGVATASQSVVRIAGSACGLAITGSGWVAGPELVVTNAHVIAGEDDTRVETADGATFDASPVVYRPRDDIAVLRVPGLGLAPLEQRAEAESGTRAAVIGYPGGGDLQTRAARLGTTGEVQSQDSYGRGPIEREMTSFRGKVQSGNSGGPVVDARGRVLATVFASAVGSDRPEGLGVPNSVVSKVLARADGAVGTGRCA